MRLHLNLNRLVYFSAVVDAGSFSAAANRLGITKAVVSQQIAKLEEETATTLFARNSRRISLTEAGKQLHERCISILKEAEEAFGEMNSGASVPHGRLRITAPFDFGVEIMTPLIIAFRNAHPACEVELHLSDKRLDLLSDGLDLAIRVGWLKDSALLARRVGGFRQVLVASPELLARFAKPDHPADLSRLPFVANLALGAPNDWTFRHQIHPPFELRLRPELAIDTTLAVREAVRRGGGVSILPDFAVAQDIKARRLIPLLEDWMLPEGGIFLVFPALKHRPTKVTAFVEMMVAGLKAGASLATGPA